MSNGPARNAAVAAAVATPELRAEVLAFADAVVRRFGANSAVGQSAYRSLGPDQRLGEEERAILSGGGLIAARAKDGWLDPADRLRRRQESELSDGQDLGLSL